MTSSQNSYPMRISCFKLKMIPVQKSKQDNLFQNLKWISCLNLKKDILFRNSKRIYCFKFKKRISCLEIKKGYLASNLKKDILFRNSKRISCFKLEKDYPVSNSKGGYPLLKLKESISCFKIQKGYLVSKSEKDILFLLRLRVSTAGRIGRELTASSVKLFLSSTTSLRFKNFSRPVNELKRIASEYLKQFKNPN